MARIKKERGCYAVQAATDINVGDYAYLNFDLKGFRHSGSCLAKKIYHSHDGQVRFHFTDGSIMGETTQD